MDSTVITPILALVLGFVLSEIGAETRFRRDDRRERLRWRRSALIELQPAMNAMTLAVAHLQRALGLHDQAELQQAVDHLAISQAHMAAIGQRIADPRFCGLFDDWQYAADAVADARTPTEADAAVRIWGEHGAAVYRRVGELLRGG